MTNTQLLVRTILQNPDRYEWSLQGFGMLRLYLSKEVRLHIWHSAFRVPGVSDIHDHPWSFGSELVCGEIVNRRYDADEKRLPSETSTHLCSRIKCGIGGGLDGDPPIEMQLRAMKPELYWEGDSYSQRATEIHCTNAIDGTVTLVRRGFGFFSEDHARVFYPLDTEWVSAEPRPATKEEVSVFVDAALSRLE